MDDKTLLAIVGAACTILGVLGNKIFDWFIFKRQTAHEIAERKVKQKHEIKTNSRIMSLERTNEDLKCELEKSQNELLEKEKQVSELTEKISILENNLNSLNNPRPRRADQEYDPFD